MAEDTGKTSLKQLLQEMFGETEAEVLQGTVLEAGGTKIKIKGDDKLIVGPNNVYVPWHLTDYETELSFDDPAIRNNVSVGHRLPLPHATLIEFPDTPDETQKEVILKGELTHEEKVKHKITIYNALKVGEEVHVLSFHHGKQYFVLDRVAK